MDPLSSLEWKAIGGIIIIAIIAGIGWKIHSDGAEIRKQDKTIVTQAVVIKGQDATIKTDGVVAESKEKTNTAVVADTASVVKKQKKVADKVEAKVQDIQDRFDQLPATPVNLEAEQQELSSVRIDSLWESYCIGVPDATECKAPQPPAVPTPQGA